MATVMKGLRTPSGDGGGGGVWAGVEEGERRVMVKRMGGAEIESWRERKCERPAGFFFFLLRSDKLTMLTHITLQCRHGNVLYEVLLTSTNHIIRCKLFRKAQLWCAFRVNRVAFATEKGTHSNMSSLSL